MKIFSKTFCCPWAVGCRKFVQDIRMLCFGRFILVESVVWSTMLPALVFIFARIQNGSLQNFPSAGLQAENAVNMLSHIASILWIQSTVEPRNIGKFGRPEFVRYWEVFRYFVGSISLIASREVSFILKEWKRVSLYRPLLDEVWN